MSKRGRMREVVLAGVIAAVAIACGEAAMKGTGAVMQDAGEWLSDAGTSLRGASNAGSGGGQNAGGDKDAGGALDAMTDAMVAMGTEMMNDAGSVLTDAGSMLADAGSVLNGAPDAGNDAGGAMMIDSASAQSTCGSCTAGMRQMIVTADQDVQQLRGGTVEGTGWSLALASTATHSTQCNTDHKYARAVTRVVNGPLVLTDAYVTGSTVSLFTVASDKPCFEDGPTFVTSVQCNAITDFISPATVARAAESRSLFTAAGGFALTGARLVIAPGETLCALVADSHNLVAPTATIADLPVSTSVVWSGFEPYE